MNLLFIAAAGAGPAPPVWMVIPFALLLLCIAIGPLAFPHWWERRYAWVSVGLGAIGACSYLIVLRNPAPLLHVAEEYAGFIALVGSLFVVAGGIHVRVVGEAKPWVNSLFLVLGAIVSNVIGTTGASMLLIRPWIRMNRYRITSFHVVFFIFIVSNVGGCLTPIGDPPLFLGYLKGVPFWWVIQNCWKAWLLAVLGLTGIFYVLDRRNFMRCPQDVRERETASEQWRFDGLHNLVFIAVILGAVFMPPGWREGVMVAAGLASWFTTSRALHEANDFNLHPIIEVAWLFLGIFATMVPALQILETHAGELGLHSEMQFYWGTGVLSGLLDNAPTYLAFLATAFGLFGLDIDQPEGMRRFITEHDHLLVAISLGAVFFGAMTYIGNGPNFMVRSIAIQQGVKTPGFLGYILRFSIPILLPFLALIGILFFSRWRLF